MKIKIVGTRDGAYWPAVGGTIVVGDDEGATLCAQGMAEPVAEAVKAKAETRRKPSEKKAEKGAEGGKA